MVIDAGWVGDGRMMDGRCVEGGRGWSGDGYRCIIENWAIARGWMDDRRVDGWMDGWMEDDCSSGCVLMDDGCRMV